VATSVIGLVQQHPDARDRCIELEAAPDCVELEGDADLLHRAVFNLVLNAVQHAGPGGVVRVALACVSPADLPVGVALRAPVRLEVSDTGPGVAPEDLPHLFDPFFTTREGGTGLGLAMVHRAVEAHGGAILVERGAEGGALFCVYLPGEAEVRV
jgi:two-component system sensor histidine kinase PilS (NtrC family)